MAMAVADSSRGSFEPRSWRDTFTDLACAHQEGTLGAEDLERLAVSAYMVGEIVACEAAWIEAHHAWLSQARPERAAQCAFSQALGLFFRGDLAPAMGWVARGGRLLEESR